VLVLVVPLAANPLGAVGLALYVAPLLQAPLEVQGSPEPVTPLFVEGLFPCVHQLAVYFTGYPRKAPSFRAGMERVDALCYTVFAGTITKFLHWNTKFVRYPRAGEARIACEVSPARMGPAAGTHRGTL
jgi:hypothetical protein